eukprot:COSAG05_NODE_2481_length_3006_cov_849.928793_3_plen_70_part_00
MQRSARVIGLLATLFQTGPAAWTIALSACVGGHAELAPPAAATPHNGTTTTAALADGTYSDSFWIVMSI